MVFVVLYDACVLYPAPLRDLFMRVAVAGLVRAKWSERVLDECFRNIQANRPELTPSALARTRELMNRAVADCLVAGYEGLIDGMTLPDPDDRHVLAAAVPIVTFNLSDFPVERLAPYDVEAIHPDDYVLGLIDFAPGSMCSIVTEQAASLRNPPRTISDLLDTLQVNGLVQSVAKLRELFGAAEGL